jgi:hypothetical protein
MQQSVKIEYVDGSSDTFVVRPPDYARWEMATKKVISQFGGMWDILFVAHSAMKREAGGKPTKALEIWMESITDIELGDDNPKVILEEA